MPERLLDTKSNTMTSNQALHELNRRYSRSYTTIALAIAGLGISVVSVGLATFLSSTVAAVLNLTGVGLAYHSVVSLISDEMKDNFAFQNAIQNMGSNAIMYITTRLYEWSSASGNSYTWYTRSSYSVTNSGPR